MDLKDRIKVTIQLLIGFKVANTQEEIGLLLGYKNKSSFSQVINGKVDLPDKFLEKLSLLDNRISKKWLINGIGYIESEQVYINNSEIYKNQNSEDLIQFQRIKINELKQQLQEVTHDKSKPHHTLELLDESKP